MEHELAIMHQVYLSLGSNINRQENIKRCLERLSEQFGEICSSPVYESEAVGFNGDCFFNLVVKLETKETLADLSVRLKEIELEQGRIRREKRFSSRTLDIDILLYDDLKGLHAGIQLPRPEVYYNAFVLLPLADLAPELKDPVSGMNFAHLWAEKAPQILTKQKLWPVEFDWPERIRPAPIKAIQD
jgi:2-amino-4-hydroxy-6-hydroxymethyldihydropteridine diphosphokinase